MPMLSARNPSCQLRIEDVAVLPADLPSGRVRYELDDGRLVIMPPPGDIHAATESNLITELKIQGERKGHGKARSGDVGIILWRDPDRLVGADAAFIATTSLPIKLSKEGYLETIPELVVEVVSKNDTTAEVNDKVKDYLKAGVQVVWVADPAKKTIAVHRRGSKTRILGENDKLSIQDVIPGFKIAVKDAFQN